ncbi:MotA/TolQ/ExbB proton channel family protein [Parvibaculum sp.]|uniref:MotA/TolQ/ExbB proton channel family protein n=1 Tax=Parvibaculum sp. TaxID=2024848 RepID=UPI00320DF50E
MAIIQTLTNAANAVLHPASLTESLHVITFALLGAAVVLVTFVSIERAIFYAVNLRQARKLEKLLAKSGPNGSFPKSPSVLSGVFGSAVADMLAVRSASSERLAQEDVAQTIFIRSRARFTQHLWMLDTVITAAPLLGLLGTIFGIIDTFVALAQAGISDPAAVSAGIGTALFATAAGIGTALYGLLFNNTFQEVVLRLSDHLKLVLIAAGMDPLIGTQASAK